MSHAPATLPPPASSPTPVETLATQGRLPWQVTACLWLLAGMALFSGLGDQAIARTQEARVLETARQMADADLRGWLVPQLNGDVRLRKPPLVYWMVAASYNVLGVSEFAGRLPVTLCAWLLLAVTYSFGRDTIGQRGGLIAAAVLASGFLFTRFSRLAETDVPAALFVTTAAWALWRAMTATTRAGRWYHLAATGAALALLAKGGPAGFVLAFFAAAIVVRRQWRAAWDFVRCGAVLNLLAIGLPWWVYAATDSAFAQVAQEIATATRGLNHGKPFWAYGPYVLLATLPWTALAVTGVLTAMLRGRRDDRVRPALLLAAAVFLPLCVVGNKQPHYLLTLLPALALIVAWVLERTWFDHGDLTGEAATNWVFGGTIVAAAVAAVAVPVVAGRQLGTVQAIDVSLAIVGLLTAALALGFALGRMRLASVLTFAIGAMAVLTPLHTYWAPRLDDEEPTRALAAEVRERLGDRPFVVYGESEDLALCFDLRRAIPNVLTPDALTAAGQAEPQLVAIAISKEDRPADEVMLPLPPAWHPVLDRPLGRSRYTFYALFPP